MKTLILKDICTPIFIAALFLLMNNWIKEMWDTHTHTQTHTMEYYSAIKKNEMLPFAGMWINLENIMFSVISQTKTNTI